MPLLAAQTAHLQNTPWSLACLRLCPSGWEALSLCRVVGSLGRHRGVTRAGSRRLPVTSALQGPSLWEPCWSHPLHLIAPVDHHVPRKGSKAQQGRRRLFPGSCASPWERQQRLVRFHAVITKLGTEKDYSSCAPFTEFSGLPLAKQIQNAAICSSCP